MNLEMVGFNILSLAGTPLMGAVAIRMLMTNLRRELPLFFAYCAYSVVQSVVLFAVRNIYGFKSVPYFFVYWALFLGETILFFFVIHEVYARVLYQYEGLRKLSSIIFRWAFMVLALAASIITLASSDADPFYGPLNLLDRCAMFVEFGLIVLLFVFAKSLALDWKECIFGIAAGICLMCSVQLVALTLRLRYGAAFAEVHAFAKPIIWITAVTIWAVYVFRSERARSNIVTLRDPELDEWNAAVLRFLNR